MMNDKFIWSSGESPTPVKNFSLKCKDCFHCIPVRTDICSEYPDCKPLGVLTGGDCSCYKKKD